MTIYDGMGRFSLRSLICNLLLNKNSKRFARIFWDESQFYEENLKPLIQQDLRISQTHSAWNQFSLHVDKLAQIT
ncbi:MAG: hypothetical protein DWH73_04225 [Planctomycetota bacterium]|nr:MAG: hypothetical protein DWH73_04225 [Planctomycetota bacterium]